MNKYTKFGLLITIIVGTLIWVATASIGQNSTYFKTVAEVNAMGKTDKRLRVGGNVENDSIVRKGSEVEFLLSFDKQVMKVVYVGSEPLPDTFRNGAQALADGKFGHDGVFRATRIQAKCASKYEPATPGKSSEPTYLKVPKAT